MMMRGLKSTIALLVVLVGLGAYIYFVTWKQTGDAPASTQERLFASLQPDKIDEITVTAESGEVTTLKKQADGWQFVGPVTARASEGEVSGLTNALEQAEIVRVIDENATNLDEYGLGTPRVQVEFKSPDGKSAGRLAFGQKAVSGGNVYVRRNDEKRVLLISDSQEASINKSTFDLRDKAVLTFKRDELNGVEVVSGGKATDLVKADGAWTLVKPVAARADFSAVEGLAGRLETAQMKSILTSEATAADLKKYGLDKPSTAITLRLGSARATFAIGGKADEQSVYARDASKSLVITIDKTLADDLAKTADDFRRKDVFEFRAYNATRIELTRTGSPVVIFERVKSTDESKPDSWKRVSPSAADVDREKVETLLTTLADFRAGSFVESRTGTGLDTPTLTVAVTFEDGRKNERVSFGRTEGGVFALTPDPGAAKLEADRLDEVTTALDELAK